jgi:hypothetical protein
MQTIKGRRFSLVDPDPADVDFEEVAEALGKLARFNGHTIGYPAYSVAQHCVMGADGLLDECVVAEHIAPYCQRMAALFLLHDAHEAYMGDITTPVVYALDHIRWPDGPPGNNGLVKQLVADLKHRLDVAIHAAAGVDMPTDAERTVIKHWDQRMLMAERNAFMGGTPGPWDREVKPAPMDLGDFGVPWEPDVADLAWRLAFYRYVRL